MALEYPEEVESLRESWLDRPPLDGPPFFVHRTTDGGHTQEPDPVRAESPESMDHEGWEVDEQHEDGQEDTGSYDSEGVGSDLQAEHDAHQRTLNAGNIARERRNRTLRRSTHWQRRSQEREQMIRAPALPVAWSDDASSDAGSDGLSSPVRGPRGTARTDRLARAPPAIGLTAQQQAAALLDREGFVGRSAQPASVAPPPQPRLGAHVERILAILEEDPTESYPVAGQEQSGPTVAPSPPQLSFSDYVRQEFAGPVWAIPQVIDSLTPQERADLITRMDEEFPDVSGPIAWGPPDEIPAAVRTALLARLGLVEPPPAQQRDTVRVGFHPGLHDAALARPSQHPAFTRDRRAPRDDPFGLRASRYSSNRTRQYISTWDDYSYTPYARRVIRSRDLLSRQSVASEMVFRMSAAATRFDDALGQVLGGMDQMADAGSDRVAELTAGRTETLKEREFRQATELSMGHVDSMQQRAEEFARAAGRARQSDRDVQEQQLDDRYSGRVEAVADASEETTHIRAGPGEDIEKGLASTAECEAEIMAGLSGSTSSPTQASHDTATVKTSATDLTGQSAGSRPLPPKMESVIYDAPDRRYPPMAARSLNDHPMSFSAAMGGIQTCLFDALGRANKHATEVALSISSEAYFWCLGGADSDCEATQTCIETVVVQKGHRAFTADREDMMKTFLLALKNDFAAFQAILQETNQTFGMNWDTFGASSWSNHSGSVFDEAVRDARDDKHGYEVDPLPVPRGEKAHLRIDTDLVCAKLRAYIDNVCAHFCCDEYNDYVSSLEDAYLDELQRSTFGMKAAHLVRMQMATSVNIAFVAHAEYVAQQAREMNRHGEEIGEDLVQQATRLMESTAGSGDQVRDLRQSADQLLRNDIR
jgi:hypothetical protein